MATRLPAADNSPHQAAEANSAEAGRTLFLQQCASCHALAHDGIGPALGGITSLLSRQELEDRIRNPAGVLAAGDRRANALFRRYKLTMPPFAHLAVWHAEAARPTAAIELLERVRDAAAAEQSSVTVLGPAPLPMERKDGRYRAQLLFRSAERAPLHRLVARTLLAVRAMPAARRARWSIDIDPFEI